jgi:cell division protein FtsB
VLRSPYQSPEGPPRDRAKRFLRLPPPETRRKHRGLWIAGLIVLAYLLWSFIGSDTGLIRTAALQRDTAALEKRRVELTARAEALEARRKQQAKDPLLEERVARERFHLVKKGEIVYRYKDDGADSAR